MGAQFAFNSVISRGEGFVPSLLLFGSYVTKPSCDMANWGYLPTGECTFSFSFFLGFLLWHNGTFTRQGLPSRHSSCYFPLSSLGTFKLILPTVLLIGLGQ